MTTKAEFDKMQEDYDNELPEDDIKDLEELDKVNKKNHFAEDYYDYDYDVFND